MARATARRRTLAKRGYAQSLSRHRESSDRRAERRASGDHAARTQVAFEPPRHPTAGNPRTPADRMTTKRPPVHDATRGTQYASGRAGAKEECVAAVLRANASARIGSLPPDHKGSEHHAGVAVPPDYGFYASAGGRSTSGRPRAVTRTACTKFGGMHRTRKDLSSAARPRGTRRHHCRGRVPLTALVGEIANGRGFRVAYFEHARPRSTCRWFAGSLPHQKEGIRLATSRRDVRYLGRR